MFTNRAGQAFASFGFVHAERQNSVMESFHYVNLTCSSGKKVPGALSRLTATREIFITADFELETSQKEVTGWLENNSRCGLKLLAICSSVSVFSTPVCAQNDVEKYLLFWKLILLLQKEWGLGIAPKTKELPSGFVIKGFRLVARSCFLSDWSCFEQGRVLCTVSDSSFHPWCFPDTCDVRCARKKTEKRFRKTIRTLRKTVSRDQFRVRLSGTDHELARKALRPPEAQQSCAVGQLQPGNRCGEFGENWVRVFPCFAQAWGARRDRGLIVQEREGLCVQKWGVLWVLLKSSPWINRWQMLCYRTEQGLNALHCSWWTACNELGGRNPGNK